MEKVLVLFRRWSKVKFEIHQRKRKIYFKEREIWWASLGANLGCEQDGKNNYFERPVLIFRKFNKDVFWALPLTTKNKKGKYYFSLKDTKPRSSVILSQLKLISSKRLLRKIRALPKEEYDKVRSKLKRLI